jgi:hypothetical protein
VLYGPWSLRLDTTSAVVRWDACRPSSAALTVRPIAGGAALSFDGQQTGAEITTRFDHFDTVPPDLPGTRYTTEVELTGLAPSTCYEYELEAEPGRTGRVCTARTAGQPFRFLAIGDTNPSLGGTAGVLDAALPFEPEFTVHVGDLQYYASVLETWATWFPDMAPLLRQGGAFMPCPGNHEYEVAGEFEDYYLRLFGHAGFDGTIDYYRFQSGGVWMFSLNTEIDLAPGSDQADWLEQQLADAAGQPGYRFGIVYLHRPMITLADYSQLRTEREHFAPLFEQHGVVLVLQGHVHGYERFVDGSVTYVTTGGGGGALHDLDVRIDDRPEEAALRQASAESYQSILFDVDATSLRARVLSDEAEVLDEFTIDVP